MRKRERFAEFILKLVSQRPLTSEKKFYYPRPEGLSSQDIAEIVQRIRQETPFSDAQYVESRIPQMLEIQLG